MKRRRKKNWIHPKILYCCLSVLCVILVLLSFKFTNRFSTIKTALGDAVTPMQKGINTVGRYISGGFASQQKEPAGKERAASPAD